MPFNVNDIATWVTIVGGVSTLPVVSAGLISIRNLWIKRRSLFIWKINKLPWVVIRPIYPGSMARVEDVIATHEVRKYFSERKISIEEISDDSLDIYDRNEIILCGPKSNRRSKQIVDNFKMTLEISFGNDGKSHIYDHTTCSILNSPMDESGRKMDLAIIAKLTDARFNSIHILVWGIHGIGTAGAARFLFQNAFLSKTKKEAGQRDFIAIVKVPFDEKYSLGEPSLHLPLRIGREVYRE